MATDRDDEARSMHWSVMEWEKDKESWVQVWGEIKGEIVSVDLIRLGPTVESGLDPVPWSRASNQTMVGGPPSRSTI